jgi:four helix bundle protein
MAPTAELSSRNPRYSGLKSWTACHDLTVRIYRLTSEWPGHEQYGLTAQARRAAYSAAANIAEGSAKRGRREFRRFLDISIGSLSELTHILMLARDLGYLRRETWGEIEAIRITPVGLRGVCTSHSNKN